MKKLFAVGGFTIAAVAAVLFLFHLRSNARYEHLHYEREETPLIISNIPRAHLTLYKAGKDLREAVPTPAGDGEEMWLPAGNYFLKADDGTRALFYPVPMVSYRGGPDKDGAFGVTIRMPVSDAPHGLLPDLPDYVFVPSGHFLFGDKLNRQEPHYVWLGGFFINPVEVTNAEFHEFWKDPNGYQDDANWTEAGRKWKAANSSNASALLKPSDADYKRFGQWDQPVVQINWYEANAFCRWLTKTVGRGRWRFGLPSEAEWEKVARGPDNFDYALGMTVSDHEASLYNWKKNPGAEITVVGVLETRSKYSTNRYGVYHMTGNVAEWTQSIYRPYNRRQPYVDDDDRNHDGVSGERVIRGGSWYTASVAVLYIPYRENFRPEVHAPYLGFRVVARPVP
jgi:formylglycine-generating enzyme required for sulfatase activity